ncbi:MAG: cobyrinate a,c-diamide synthase [Terriglobales bacterium]
MRALIVAGTHSGVGKTTLSLALLQGLRERGLRVRAFKAGPDFLDATHLARAAQADCLNLDTWMLGPELCRRRLEAAAAACDFALVEGMMGLFDGRSGGSDEGSTAELARCLGLPVVLVADASAGVRSVAATVLGFRQFDPGLRLAGVILNRVGGAAHLDMLREAMHAVPGVEVLGGAPVDPRLHLPERHLGLCLDHELQVPAGWAADHVDLDRLLQLALEIPAAGKAAPPFPPAKLRMGVARDAAFCFYYPDNLEALRHMGIELVEFSPLRDHALPDGIAGIYLGGGYPELHAASLSRNHAMCAAIRGFAAAGGFIYAECGGMMYLARELDGTAMAGVLPCSVRMEKRPQAVGYREVMSEALLGPQGPRVRGHEFHYSTLQREGASEPAHLVLERDGGLRPEGFLLNNVVASYIHLHFASCPELAGRLRARMS